MFPYITIAGHRFFTYDFMGLIGTAIAILCFYRYLRQFPVNKNQVILALTIAFGAQHIGGTILPLLYRWIYLHQTPWLNVLKNSPGRYFHSVFLSTLLYWIIVSKILRWPVWKVLDGFILTFLLSSPIGRIGCLMQGCCMGKPSDLPWAIRVSYSAGVPGIPRHPVQAYMAILEFMLIAFLWYFYKKKRRYDGQTFWLALLLYSGYRFSIEFLRTNPPAAFGYSHAQFFSVAAIAVSSLVLARHKKWTP